MLNAATLLAFAGMVALVSAGCSREVAPAEPDGTTAEEAARFGAQRKAMVTTQIEARGVADQRVLEAMRSVPRHLFVPEQDRARSYADYPLPIGEGQTISQPYIVALMTELLEVSPGEKVLEIGTGSGYQAAILAEIGAEVFSIEIITVLGERARRTLADLGHGQLRAKIGDGYFGWEEHAPFDAIIVTAAPDHVPRPLLDQLGPDGKMVIPVGPPGGVQTLWLIEQRGGDWVSLNQGGVRFVPFLR